MVQFSLMVIWSTKQCLNWVHW